MMICHGFELTHLIYLHILSLMKLVIEARICMKKLTVDGHGESARWIGGGMSSIGPHNSPLGWIKCMKKLTVDCHG